MQEFPFVSVIIPAYNESLMLERTLPALNKINYKKDRYEIIVVDNGSTDGTEKISAKYNAKVILFPEGKTIAAVRNRGALEAKGDVLAFLDADCLVTENWLLNAVKSFKNGVGVVGSKGLDPLYVSTWVQNCRSKIIRRSKEEPIYVDWLSSVNMLLKKDLFDQVGGFDEKLETCEDADIGFRLNKITKILFNPKVKAYHLREPKTLLDLFKKELWHGKSLYKGVFRHGLLARELISILVPFIYLINLFVLVFSILLQGLNIFLISCLFFIAFPLAMNIRQLSRIDKPLIFFQCLLINTTYLLGRSFSVIYSLKDLVSK